MGTAHVFDLESGDELFALTPEDARPGQGFGSSVALVDELNIALVGAPRDDELRFNGGAV